MTEYDRAPQMLTATRLVGWSILESIPEDQRGDILYQEARRVIANVRHELASRLPDHQVDEYSLLLELRVTYLVHED